MRSRGRTLGDAPRPYHSQADRRSSRAGPEGEPWAPRPMTLGQRSVGGPSVRVGLRVCSPVRDACPCIRAPVASKPRISQEEPLPGKDLAPAGRPIDAPRPCTHAHSLQGSLPDGRRPADQPPARSAPGCVEGVAHEEHDRRLVAQALDVMRDGWLAYARTLEGMAWLNISLNMANGWTWQDGWKLVGPTGPTA